MSQCTTTTPTYQSMYSSTSDGTMTAIIVLSVIVPLQLICFVGFCIYTKFKKKIVVQPTIYSVANDDKSNSLHAAKNRQQQGEQNKKGKKNQILETNKKQNKNSKSIPDQGRCTKLINKINKCLISCASKNTLIILSVVSILLVFASLIMVGVSIIPSEQALGKFFPQAECKLNQTVSSFISGDDSWIGLSNMIPNVTKLQLNLNTRVKATKNSILALVLNGSTAAFPIGFPNATTTSGTNITGTTVQNFIESKLRIWLTMNSSLSSIYRFPICQNTAISNIPHPVNDGQTIQLNYMASICSNLTQQVNQLVANGRSVDQLYLLTRSIDDNRISTHNNLTLYNNTISGISSRANQYSTQFSSTKIDVSGQRIVPYVMLGLSAVIAILTVVYFSCQFYKLNKYLAKQDEELSQIDDEGEEEEEAQRPRKNNKNRRNTKNHNKNGVMVSLQKISISASSQLSPEQIKRQKADKMKSIMRHGLFGSSSWTHAFNTIFLLILLAIASSTFLFNSFSTKAQGYCQNFTSVLNGQKILQSAFELSASQKELLSPVQSCLSNPLAGGLGATNSQNHFLETLQTSTYLSNIEQLYRISSLYNLTTPVNVLKSISLQQIQILKNYLLHMETMPIKSPDFTIQSILSQLNTYTNGSASTSRQRVQCNATLLRDEYVYNAADCNYPLINYTLQTTVNQARCLQIPTWDGSGGSKDADLNDAQHTIQLINPCNTVFDFYNGTNLNCFLGKRLELLRAGNCTQTAAQYNRRIKNLIKFSVETASYTNSYLQNLRNYFGMYSVLSTNLTEFFNGANTSAMLNQFGTLSNNLINKTSCSYVKSSVQNIYDAYCPEKNNIPMLLHDSYVFVLIAFGIGSFAWGVILLQQLLAMVYAQQFVIEQEQKNQEEFKLQPYFANNQINQREKIQREQKLKAKKGESPKNKNRLEISQQTLRNDDREQQEDKMQRMRDLDIIQGTPKDRRHLNYLEVQPIQRIRQKYEKDDSEESGQSQPVTEQHDPEYDYDNLQNQQTGKKLMVRQRYSSSRGEEHEHEHEHEQNQEPDLKNVTKQKNQKEQQKNKQSRLDVKENYAQDPKIQTLNLQIPREIKSKTGYPRLNKKLEQPEQIKGKSPKAFYQTEDSKKQKIPAAFFKTVTAQNQDDSRIDDFTSKYSYKKERKVQSKAEVRRQTENVRHQKSIQNHISKVKKQGSEDQRLKVIELDGILKQSVSELGLELHKQKNHHIDKKETELPK